MDSAGDTLAGGLPHSDIHGSMPARGSPWLCAACHVLHRLLVPRHPPNALLSLGIQPILHRSQPHPPSDPRYLGSPIRMHRFPPRPGHDPAHAASERIARSQAAIPRVRGRLPVRHCDRARPETHQNLIHPDKDPDPTDPARRTAALARQNPGTTARRHAPKARRRRGADCALSSAIPADSDRPSAISHRTPRLETIGFEPTTPCLQSRCSPS
jgi:hypothetical protein